jgi:hypothetical protein
MWVYIKSEPGLWTVGHYDPAGSWIAESDHDDPGKAANRVHHLNGGTAVNADLLAVCVALVEDDDIAQGYGGLYARLNKLRDLARPAIAKAKGV